MIVQWDKPLFNVKTKWCINFYLTHSMICQAELIRQKTLNNQTSIKLKITLIKFIHLKLSINCFEINQNARKMDFGDTYISRSTGISNDLNTFIQNTDLLNTNSYQYYLTLPEKITTYNITFNTGSTSFNKGTLGNLAIIGAG